MAKFLKPKEVAELLRVPISWIYDRTGKTGPETIPHLKMGKYLRFNPESEAFQEWLRNHEIGNGECQGEAR